MATFSAYPTSIVTTFTTHQNSVEIIDAAHPNLIQAEVLAIETTVGVTPNTSGLFGKSGNNFLTYTTAANTTPDITTYIYAGQTTFSTVSDRITNVEALANLAYSTASGLTSLPATVASHTLSIDNIYKITIMGGF